MKSSDPVPTRSEGKLSADQGGAAGGPFVRRRIGGWAGVVLSGALLLGSIGGIGELRPWLSEHYHEIKISSDVYALPTPDQTIVASLGHRSAVADMLFAYSLVSYGIHIQEKRHFQFAGNYLETAVVLEPSLYDVYYYADTIMTLQTVPTPPADVVKAREIVERGLRQFPNDARLWLNAGQFVAYLAPSRFTDRPTQQEWRKAGARMLAHACGLFDEKVLPRHCIGAATILTAQGERAAVIDFLERVLALSDDPEVRAKAELWLDQKLGEERQLRIRERRRWFESKWKSELPMVPRELFAVLPPSFDPARCAGAMGHGPCATSFGDAPETLEP